MNKELTKIQAAPIIGIVKTVWGCLALLHRCGGEGVKGLTGNSKCRVSLLREGQGGSHMDRNNTRHFYFVPTVKNIWRCAMPEKWYLPQDTRDVADSLEHITNLTAFLEDSFAFRDMNHSFSDKEVCGLCLMFSFIGDVLMRGNQILLRKGGVL